VDGELVGRASIRFELNEFFASRAVILATFVLPDFRRRGYATEILRQSLVIARAGGVDPVLMYCSDTNVDRSRPSSDVGEYSMKYSPTIGAYHRGVVTGSTDATRGETSELLRFVDGQLRRGVGFESLVGNEFTAGD